MLKLLRKKGVARKIIWVIAVVIILSFGFFGTAYLLTGGDRIRYAGQMFNKNVPLDTFNKAFHHIHIQAMMRFGEKFNEIAKFLNLKEQAWDRLILLYEAQKRRIKVSDREVIETIEQYPFLQRDGQFDPLLYKDVLRYVFRIPARDFEEGIRDDLKLAELFRQETASLTVNAQEIHDVFKKQNEKVQVSYILVSSGPFKNEASFSEEKGQAYYAQNNAQFLVPPTVNVEYISLDFPKPEPEAIGDSAKPTEAAAPPPAQAVDEESRQEKTEPRSTQSPSPLDETKKPVREKANTIFQELLIDPDIRKAAQKYDVVARSSGFFSMERPNLALGWSYELLNKIFNLQENEIVEPFETPQGIVIIKTKAKKKSYIPGYEECKEKVKEAVLNEEAKGIARQKTEGYLAAVKAAGETSSFKDFPKTAKDLGLEIRQTPVFGRGHYLPQIGISKEFQEAAFRLTEANPLGAEVIETEGGYCILHLDSYLPADEKQYEREKETLSQSLLDERRTQAFNDFLSRLRLKASITSNIPQQNETF
jgi:peptidyl-prolyl cis-trans isomerase D